MGKHRCSGCGVASGYLHLSGCSIDVAKRAKSGLQLKLSFKSTSEPNDISKKIMVQSNFCRDMEVDIWSQGMRILTWGNAGMNNQLLVLDDPDLLTLTEFRDAFTSMVCSGQLKFTLANPVDEYFLRDQTAEQLAQFVYDLFKSRRKVGLRKALKHANELSLGRLTPEGRLSDLVA